jgi:predicted nucleic acid-binding Zn ribbon protein
MERTCLTCGEVLHGRADKKFCSDQCRNEYNNRERRSYTNYMRQVNGILQKNRRILSSFNPDGKAKIHKSKLLDEGFNFNYFTNIYRTKAGKTYYFCYEQGYLFIEDDYLALVHKQDYI